MIYSVVIAVAFSCVLDLELFLLYIANLSQVKNGRKKTMMLMTMLIELCDNPF